MLLALIYFVLTRLVGLAGENSTGASYETVGRLRILFRPPHPPA